MASRKYAQKEHDVGSLRHAPDTNSEELCRVKDWRPCTLLRVRPTNGFWRGYRSEMEKKTKYPIGEANEQMVRNSGSLHTLPYILTVGTRWWVRGRTNFGYAGDNECLSWCWRITAQNMDELVGPPVGDKNEFGYAGDNESLTLATLVITSPWTVVDELWRRVESSTFGDSYGAHFYDDSHGHMQLPLLNYVLIWL